MAIRWAGRWVESMVNWLAVKRVDQTVERRDRWMVAHLVAWRADHLVPSMAETRVGSKVDSMACCSAGTKVETKAGRWEDYLAEKLAEKKAVDWAGQLAALWVVCLAGQ